MDGVVALPVAEIDHILDRADARTAHEREVMALLRQGRTTLELYDLEDR